ncbi:hypothetical protein D3C81_1247320 [compost metagenome]
MASIHPDLIPVINTRSTHVSEEGDGGHFQLVLVPFAKGQQASGIMTVNQIEGNFAGLLRISRQLHRNGAGESACIQGSIYDEIGNCECEWIVHDGIELVTLKPWGGFVPNFAQNIGIRVHPFHHFTELAPEVLIHFIGYIQAPSINADLFDPVFSYLEQVLFDLRMPRIQLGHVWFKGKGVISRIPLLDFEREAVHMKPVLILRSFAFLLHVQERSESTTRVVEYGIQQNADTPVMAELNELLERFDVTELWINPHIILSVILVIRSGCK